MDDRSRPPREAGFLFAFGHANGERLVFVSRDLFRRLKWIAAGLGAALSLLGAGFLWGRARRR